MTLILLLINAIWGYQWTKRPTALTDELKDTLYDQSQVIDIAVKLYALSSNNGNFKWKRRNNIGIN